MRKMIRQSYILHTESDAIIRLSVGAFRRYSHDVAETLNDVEYQF